MASEKGQGDDSNSSQDAYPSSQVFFKERSTSTSDTDAERSEEDYSSDTLSFLEKHPYTSSWENTFLCSLNISPMLRNPSNFMQPCDLILEASFCSKLSETKLRESINQVAERVDKLGKEMKSYPPDAFSFINTNDVQTFTISSIFPSADSWKLSDGLQQTEPEFCNKFCYRSFDFMDNLQNLVKYCQRRRMGKEDVSADEDQGNRKRRISQETLELSDVPEKFYEQLFISFAKMCGVFAFSEPEKQSMHIKGHSVISRADILLADLSIQTPKQRMLAVVEVKKPKRVEDDEIKKRKRETRQLQNCYTHYLSGEPELVGQHGGEMLLYSPLSLFNDNGVVGIIVQGTLVTFSWLKIIHHQFKQMSDKKIQTTAEIRYSREYNYFSEEGRIEVIKALFMLSLIGKIKYDFPKLSE